MMIIELNRQPDSEKDAKLVESYSRFEKLLSELRKRDLPDAVVRSVNGHIEVLNAASGSGDDMRKQVKTTQTRIIRLLEKEIKLVPKNYYRNLWMPVGMAAFGISFGVAFGAALGNMAFIGIGLPIGLAIGLGVGTAMDKKALEEGRQLDLEIG